MSLQSAHLHAAQEGSGRPRATPGAALNLLAPLDQPLASSRRPSRRGPRNLTRPRAAPLGLIELTVNEFRHLFDALLLAGKRTIDTLLRLVHARRRHRARARARHLAATTTPTPMITIYGCRTNLGSAQTEAGTGAERARQSFRL